MDTLTNTLISPPQDWDVKVRNYRMSDFKLFWKGLPYTLIMGAVVFLTPDADKIMVYPGGDLFSITLGLFIPIALGNVVLLLAGLSVPPMEATKQAEAKADEWKNGVLLPFLEKRYGVQLAAESRLFYGGYADGIKDGQKVKLRLNGVSRHHDSFKFADWSYPCYRVDMNSLSLEEVHLPTEKISFTSLPPVV